jgi:hypothetical protein
MKSEPIPDRPLSSGGTESRTYIGRFVRRQGNFGTILVVGRGGTDIEMLDDVKKLFPRDGLVETQGVILAGLMPGDWTEFDVVRNPRPRAPEYKTAHLRRLPRYAVLPESTPAAYRTLLTKTGWTGGERRGGVWALRISGDRVIVTELAAGSDGRLRIPTKAARNVNWCEYRDELVKRISFDGASDDVFVGDCGASDGSFDWSDEADHVAQVIRSLADANDPRVGDLISWLELHHEAGTGRVFAAAVEHDAAEAALRSGELADRLKADRDLMSAYLDAALNDDQVREAIADWAREGHGTEAERLREELNAELEREREAGLAQIAVEVDRKRTEEFEKIEAEAARLAQTRRTEIDDQLRGAENSLAGRLRELEADFNRRREELESQAEELAASLDKMREAMEQARSQLDQVKSDEIKAKDRLASVAAEVDRLVAISGQLDWQNRQPAAPLAGAGGVGTVFHERPQVAAFKKGSLIARNVLLTDHGRGLLQEIVALMLAGELPVLAGSEAPSLVTVAQALLCPGRSASVEADPTIISIDDLWSRPGSGAPTAIAAATKAAEAGGATFVSIRSIERSGARIWQPALAEALRTGGLPRGLLVACLTGDPEHEEIAALPNPIHLIEVEGALSESAYLAGPALLSPPNLDLETLALADTPPELAQANRLLATLGFKPPLDLGLRIARIYVEAVALVGDEGVARTMVDRVARRMAETVGLQTP